MNFGILKDVDWQYVGALLARGSDEEQAEFFRGFLHECKSWGTTFQLEQQLACVNLKLTDEEKEILAMLSYIEETYSQLADSENSANDMCEDCGLPTEQCNCHIPKDLEPHLRSF
jgi:hypothetical protein